MELNSRILLTQLFVNDTQIARSIACGLLKHNLYGHLAQWVAEVRWTKPSLHGGVQELVRVIERNRG